MYPNTSNHNSKEDFTIKPHNFVELAPKVTVILDDANLDKIKYLCKLIPRDEWSGVLFYSIKEGSIKTPSEMIIEIKDILPLDKGTAAYTAYALDNRFVEYMMDTPEAMEWHIGHIHSHNVMGVFFSGTDNAELKDNAPNHNLYLSMIVNNYMDMIAKIAIQGTANKKIPKVPVLALDEDGNKYTLDKKDFKVDTTFIYTYDCNIEANISSVEVSEGFNQKVQDLFKPKEVKKPVVTYTPTFQTSPNQNSKAPTYTAPSNQKSFDFTKKNNVKGDFKYESAMDSYKKVDTTDLQLYADFRLTYENIILEAFGRASLLKEMEPDEPVDFYREIMDIMDEFEEDYKSSAEVAREFFEEYLGVYATYIDSNTNEDFVFHTYRIIEVLEEFSSTNSKYIKPIVTLAQRTVEKFIEDNLDKK